MNSLRLPKRLTMHGDDEKDHMFLVSGVGVIGLASQLGVRSFGDRSQETVTANRTASMVFCTRRSHE